MTAQNKTEPKGFILPKMVMTPRFHLEKKSSAPASALETKRTHSTAAITVLLQAVENAANALLLPIYTEIAKLTHPTAAVANLMWAIENNDLFTIRRLIAMRVNINHKFYNHDSPLFKAIFAKNYDIFDLLFSEGNPDISVRSLSDESLAEAVALYAPWPTEQKIYILEKIRQRWIALPPTLFAATVGSKRAVAEEKLPVNDNQDNNQVMYACANGYTEIVQMCIKRHNSYLEQDNVFKETPLLIAAAANQPKTVQSLLEMKADPQKRDADGNTAFLLAAKNGAFETVKLLFSKENMADCNQDGDTPLILAAARGDIDTIQFLIKQGANIKTEKDKHGNNVIGIAAAYGRFALIKFLLKNNLLGLNDHAKGYPNLVMLAAGHGQLGLLIWLHKEKGMALGNKDINGESALLYAASFGHIHVIEWLEKQGFDLDERNNFGQNILLRAAGSGHLSLLIWLREEKKMSLATKDATGETPLISAAGHGHMPIVEWLLANGSELNERTLSGLTALELATHKKHTKIVKYLLKQIAEKMPFTSTEDYGYAKAKALAQQGKKSRIIKIFEEFEKQFALEIQPIPELKSSASSTTLRFEIPLENVVVLDENHQQITDPQQKEALINSNQVEILTSFFLEPKPQKIVEQLHKELSAIKTLLKKITTEADEHKPLLELARQKIKSYKKSKIPPTNADLSLITGIKTKLEKLFPAQPSSQIFRKATR